MATLVIANLLIPAAVLTFAAGFFPYKPFLPGLAEHDVSERGEMPPAQFDKVILMVVDALRSDFVFGKSSGFKFTQSLIANGAALPFTAHATSPTVTMPRVKAITTGSIPSFLDVILNFAESDTTSTLAYQDTWLAQIKAKGGNLVMHGDDTWLKLFPETFYRADGTTSFFVSDFTEVDNNVTRHVPDELRANDWNALIMHYLGLDHIGHKAGPLSPNMIPKQQEMDGIVQQIFEAIENDPHLQSTLLVLCGDHGMTDGGNHGGSAPGETSPALVFISPKFKSISTGLDSPVEPHQDFDFYTKVEQSDIVPTIAGLLGLPVSLNNLGVFISELLPLWKNERHHVLLLLNNVWQMHTLVKTAFPHEAYEHPYSQLDCSDPSSSGMKLVCKWRRITDIIRVSDGREPAPPVILPALIDFCKSAQEIMSSTASNYNMAYLLSGIALAFLSVALTTTSARSIIFRLNAASLYFGLVLVLYGILMFASSYVEEEHHFWYWTTCGWIALLCLQTLLGSYIKREGISKTIFKAAALLLFHRLVRAWNQTGQKHSGEPDFVTSFLLPNPHTVWILVGVTYFMLSLSLGSHLCRHIPPTYHVLTHIAAAGIAIPAFIFKLSFTARDAPEIVRPVVGESGMRVLEGLSLVLIARAVFLLCALGTVWVISLEVWGRSPAKRNAPRGVELFDALHAILSIFLITQTRAHNVPLFLLFSLQFLCLRDALGLQSTQTQITISTLLFAHTSFFALGNTNAISSIDLSNAYNGVAGYDVGVVGLLVFLSNWSGPVWWAWGGICLLASQGALFGYLALQTLFIAGSLLAIMVACTALRTHLFIWTVFSPKYLYAMAWSLGWHLLVCCYGLGAIWWAMGVS
ncbi:alkaline phosphatase-like protein [Rhizodiscina lignyota]|uniref:GPI ethanolamine phosphate transferase 2 n=1 Tax=Rhizodiscina lignyota TaxID=1504668 RepID=A0A9P4M478_9PEZI|nr:alkaline phosphatase-like protein [Rhizodiscina lignyota]